MLLSKELVGVGAGRIDIQTTNFETLRGYVAPPECLAIGWFVGLVGSVTYRW
jgi:hypothetical protein